MAFGKIGKAFKKAVRKVTKTVRSVTDPVTGALIGGAAPVAQEVQAPDVQAPVAQIVEVPKADDVVTEDESQTESGRRKARAGGKKSLSVARSSGNGINV